MAETAITPTREQNYSEWYQEVIRASNMAENSPVRGSMVIKPWGYAIWENIQSVLDGMFKETGHVNAYFPLLIPLSFMEKEAEHVEGFAKECAVVTHHRLKAASDGRLRPDPESQLEEPYIIRPTSETIIGHMYAKWVQSYRDLPILMNQWCNVMRWEMRTRLFLRTSEFLWQEGHTVHATAEEAVEETLRMLEVYVKFATEYLAMPVIAGKKTKDERFPGAVDTYTIEGLMQDRRALQAGTSHFLGQNFARGSGIKFLNAEGVEEIAWTTSWGVSTRLVGGLVMTHSDDNGLVLPPRIAPLHVILLPIYRDENEKAQVLSYVEELAQELKSQDFMGQKLRVKVDLRDLRGGEKSWQAIKEGIPLRVEIGPRDIAKNAVFLGRRDMGPKEKTAMDRKEFVKSVGKILEQMQQGLLERALGFRNKSIHSVHTLKEFEAFFDEGAVGGFAYVPWSEGAIGHEVLTRLKVTPRCIPLRDPLTSEIPNISKDERCLFTGNEATHRVLFARAY